MIRHRKKKQPDTLRVNFVQPSVSKKGRMVKIKPVSYSFTPPSVSPSITPAPTPISTYDAPLTSCSASFYQDDVDHTSRKEKSSEAWFNIRPKLVPAMVSGSGFPASNQLCVFCGQNPVSVWCPDCGPLAYLCEVFSKIALFFVELLLLISVFRVVDSFYTTESIFSILLLLWKV